MALMKELMAEVRRYDEFFSESVVGMDSKAYVRDYWRTFYREGREIGPRPVTWRSIGRGDGLPGSGYFQGQLVGCLRLLEVTGFPFWLAMRMVTGRIARLTRPKYYDADNERRRAFRALNRKIEPRWTRNPQPEPEVIVEAFRHAKESAEAMIRFGSLMDDLECHLDNSLMFNEYGRIVGRKGGVRQYLRNVIPELFPKYKTVMRYRLIAKNFRRACNGGDPVPPADYLPPDRTNGLQSAQPGNPRSETRFEPLDARCLGIDQETRGESQAASFSEASGKSFAPQDETITPHILISGGGEAEQGSEQGTFTAEEGITVAVAEGSASVNGRSQGKREGTCLAAEQNREQIGADEREIAARILAGWKGTILSLVTAIGKELASREEEEFVAAGRRATGEGGAAKRRKRLTSRRRAGAV